jgi:hypothetical protein
MTALLTIGPSDHILNGLDVLGRNLPRLPRPGEKLGRDFCRLGLCLDRSNRVEAALATPERPRAW